MATQHVKNLKSALHLCVADAEAAGVMAGNPVQHSRIPKTGVQTHQAIEAIESDQVISIDQYCELRAWLLDGCDSRWAIPTYVAGETGARRGEVPSPRHAVGNAS